MFRLKHTKETIENIDDFFNIIDRALLVFKDGVKNYLYDNAELFGGNLQIMISLEADASKLRQKIDSSLYMQSAFMQIRGDIMRLMEKMDHIVDILHNNLVQFEIERPYFPVELNGEYIKLTELSTLAVDSVIPAAKAYFKSPDAITEKIHRVYFYEKETAKQAQSIKRKVFHDMNALKLSEKFHLRYFALHIETLARYAEKTADQLSVMAIKRSL